MRKPGGTPAHRNGTTTETINLAHLLRKSNPTEYPTYIDCYRAAKRAAQDYGAGLSDPINRGAGAQSEPAIFIAHNVTPTLLEERLAIYNQEVALYFGNPYLQGVEEYLMFRATIVRVENENNATHLVNWRFLIFEYGNSGLDRER